MKLYMAVTADEYELPLCIEDSAKKLSDHTGIKYPTIRAAISRGHDGRYLGMKFVMVKVDEND